MQDEVAAAWKALLKEMSEMRLTPNKDALAALIQSASGLDEAAYEADSFAAMKTALAAAEDVYADENATEEDVATATSELQGALAALVKTAPAAGGSTAAGSDDSRDISGTSAAGADSTAKVSTAATSSAVKTGDTANTAATAAVMLGALAAAGLAAGFLSRKKEQ